MMILAAVILVIGLVAVAAMVARVGQLAGEAAREQDRPVLRESDPLMAGLALSIARLTDPSWGGLKSATVAYDDAVAGVLAHSRQLEASRGFQLEYSFNCSGASFWAVVSLSDGDINVQARVTTQARTTCAAPGSLNSPLLP